MSLFSFMSAKLEEIGLVAVETDTENMIGIDADLDGFSEPILCAAMGKNDEGFSYINCGRGRYPLPETRKPIVSLAWFYSKGTRN